MIGKLLWYLPVLVFGAGAAVSLAGCIALLVDTERLIKKMKQSEVK